MNTTTHGQYKTKTYVVWKGMKSRCNNPKNVKAYKFHGGKGIRYDPNWQYFEAFLADMGHCPPEKTLHRRDRMKDYTRENCFYY